MRTAFLLFANVLGFTVLTAVPSAADHNAFLSAWGSASAALERSVAPERSSVAPERSSPAPERSSVAPERSSVDVDLKLGMNGFRIGARVFGKEGYTGGAWINGETRPEGFSVDGRLEREGGKSWNFKLNADIDETLRKAIKWWGGGLTDL